MWDGITFAFLMFQRRIFNSYYFFHIRAETEAQAKLASRLVSSYFARWFLYLNLCSIRRVYLVTVAVVPS